MANFEQETCRLITRAGELTNANKSNDAFWWLFPVYLTREQIFTVPGSVWSPSPPDNKLESAGLFPARKRASTRRMRLFRT